MFTANLLSAYGWFAGLLVIMIFITLLFGFIVVIALKPIKTDKAKGDAASTKKLLGRRETELTIELMNKQNDSQTKEELIGKLRRVKAAEDLVDELVNEENAVADEVEAEESKKSKKPAKAKRGEGDRSAKAKPHHQKPAQVKKPKKPSKDFSPQVDLESGEKAAPAKSEENDKDKASENKQ